MSLTKRILILAMSDKHKECCVAGIDQERKLVRLISDDIDIGYAIPKGFVQSNDIHVFDVVDVKVEEVTEQQNPYTQEDIDLLQTQPENFLLVSNFKKVKTLSIEEALKVIEQVKNRNKYIFGDSGRSISPSFAKKVHHSLELVELDQLELQKDYKSSGEAKRHFKTVFTYNGTQYDGITDTDPDYQDPRSISKAYALISLGEKYNGSHYKLVAKIIEIPSKTGVITRVGTSQSNGNKYAYISVDGDEQDYYITDTQSKALEEKFPGILAEGVNITFKADLKNSKKVSQVETYDSPKG